MNKTTGHVKKLYDIVKKDGIVRAFDYDVLCTGDCVYDCIDGLAFLIEDGVMRITRLSNAVKDYLFPREAEERTLAVKINHMEYDNMSMRSLREATGEKYDVVGVDFETNQPKYAQRKISLPEEMDDSPFLDLNELFSRVGNHDQKQEAIDK